MVTALSMMLVLLLATRPFQIMPLNALAAIVIAGVMPLVDFGSLLPLVKVNVYAYRLCHILSAFALQCTFQSHC